MKRALIVIALLAACSEHRPFEHRVGSFDVDIVTPEEHGNVVTPLLFPEAGIEVVVDVHALDQLGEPYRDFNCTVFVDARPGVIDDRDRRLTLTGGEALGARLRLKNSFGSTRIWIEDVLEEAGCDLDRSYALGLAPELYFEQPSLTQMQITADAFTSPLVGNYVGTDRGTLIVTGIGNDGFFVTDVSAEGWERGYNHMYMFNFSYPENLVVADVLYEINGIVQEFSGATQLTFPSWTKHPDFDGPVVELMPDPVELTAALVAGSYNPDDRNKLEALESGVVRVVGALMPTRVEGGCDIDESGAVDLGSQPELDCRDACFDDLYCTELTALTFYGQWTVTLPGCTGSARDCRLGVLSRDAVPEFDPVATIAAYEREGRLDALPTLDITGNLRHTRAARPRWIIVVREPGDFVIHDHE